MLRSRIRFDLVDMMITPNKMISEFELTKTILESTAVRKPREACEDAVKSGTKSLPGKLSQEGFSVEISSIWIE